MPTGLQDHGVPHEFKWLDKAHIRDDGYRVFYTALGHTRESYVEPAFVTHLREAIRWTARQ